MFYTFHNQGFKSSMFNLFHNQDFITNVQNISNLIDREEYDTDRVVFSDSISYSHRKVKKKSDSVAESDRNVLMKYK